MLASDLTKGVFCVAHPDFETSKHFTKVFVEYDAEFTEYLIDSAVNFWKTTCFLYYTVPVNPKCKIILRYFICITFQV